MKIEWRDIVGWEGWYQVSNFGNVRSLKARGKWKAMRILKNINCEGYCYVNLYRYGIVKRKPVHQLVLEDFGPPKPSPDYEVNHKNGVKDDNRIENLEWVTGSENMQHAFEMGLRNTFGENHPQAKLNVAKVMAIKKKISEGESFDDLSEEFDISDSSIHDIASGRTWKSVR